MACDYQWTWRRNFAAQYLLVLQRSVGVFSFLSLKLRVISIRVHGAFLNAQGIFWSFFIRQKKPLFDLLKSVINKQTGNCWRPVVFQSLGFLNQSIY